MFFEYLRLQQLFHKGRHGRSIRLEFLSPFLWRVPPLEMRGECPEFFPDQAGKDSLISSYEAETGLSGCRRDPRASSIVETGMSGNFLICSKGVKDLLEVPEVRCD